MPLEGKEDTSGIHKGVDEDGCKGQRVVIISLATGPRRMSQSSVGAL